MRDRVHPAGHRQVGRQAEGELGVVDDAHRQDARVAAGALGSSFGDPPDRGHLRAGVRGGDGDDRQVVPQRHRLAESDRRAAADGDAPVRAQGCDPRGGVVDDLDRHVHPGHRQDTRRAGAECVGDLPSGGLLPGGAQHEHPLQPDGGHVVRHDVSSPRFVATVGEPLHPEVVVWTRDVLGLPADPVEQRVVLDRTSVGGAPA